MGLVSQSTNMVSLLYLSVSTLSLIHLKGGMWKNKHAGVSAKIKGKAKVKNSKDGEERVKEKSKSTGTRKEGGFHAIDDHEEGNTDFSGRDSDTS